MQVRVIRHGDHVIGRGKTSCVVVDEDASLFQADTAAIGAVMVVGRGVVGSYCPRRFAQSPIRNGAPTSGGSRTPRAAIVRNWCKGKGRVDVSSAYLAR